MLGLFYIFSISTISECIATTNHDIFNDTNYKLIHIQVVTRHGARSPLDPFLPKTHRGSWQCDSSDSNAPRVESVPFDLPRRIHHLLDPRMAEYPPNCRLGDLLIDGMDQHLELGKSYRNYLINNLNFLPNLLDPNLIFIRATAYDRTYRSALSFLNGFYPPATQGEILNIITGSPTLDPLRPNKDVCLDIKNLYDNFISSDNFKFFKENTIKEIENILNYLNETTTDPKRIDKICDWVTTMYCNDKLMYPNITQNEINSCRKFQGFMLYGLYGKDDETRGIGYSYGMREMFKILDESISGINMIKFVLLSAHDSTIAAFLSLLGYSNEFIPPLASNIAMEIYKKDQEHFIRFVYNGIPLQLPLFSNNILIKLHDFKQKIFPLINKCPEMP